MRLPDDHPLRRELNDEAHARPPEVMAAPLRLSFLALIGEPATRDAEWPYFVSLLRRYAIPAPAAPVNHFSANLGPFRVKWERHTEFTRYKFIVPGVTSDPFDPPAIDVVPTDWLAGLGGTKIAAVHAALWPTAQVPEDVEVLASRWFDGNVLVGASIADGAARAFTDFRIHGDGFSRLLVADAGLTARQAGRTIQRLLEMEAYRLMALLALPVARDLGPFLSRHEHDLAEITRSLAQAQDVDEAALLDRLTRLEAAIEEREAGNHYRFGAARAYYELIRRRIDELREDRLPGVQTFREFTERRLAPAMNTCEAVWARQQALSERAARATQLLSTRVDIASERQNQALLASMDRRVKLQLRLQQTVEGLSVAAITYYVVGLVGYLAKGMQTAGLPVDPGIAMAVSIPLVAGVIAWALWRIRRRVGVATK